MTFARSHFFQKRRAAATKCDAQCEALQPSTGGFRIVNSLIASAENVGALTPVWSGFILVLVRSKHARRRVTSPISRISTHDKNRLSQDFATFYHYTLHWVAILCMRRLAVIPTGNMVGMVPHGKLTRSPIIRSLPMFFASADTHRRTLPTSCMATGSGFMRRICLPIPATRLHKVIDIPIVWNM